MRQLSDFRSEIYFSGGSGIVRRFQCHGLIQGSLFGVMSDSGDGENRVYGSLVFDLPSDEEMAMEDDQLETVSAVGTDDHKKMASFKKSDQTGEDCMTFDEFRGWFSPHAPHFPIFSPLDSNNFRAIIRFDSEIDEFFFL